MREVHRSQFQLGQVPVEKVWINPKSRDDIPAVLKGLQHIWCDEALRARLFVLLDEHILPEADRTVGRPGMDLWQISRLIADVRADMRAERAEIRADVRALTTAVLSQQPRPQ